MPHAEQTGEPACQSILLALSPQTHRPPWDVVIWEIPDGIRLQGVSDEGNRFIRREKAKAFGRITSTVEMHTMVLMDYEDTEAIWNEMETTGLRTRTI